MNMLLLLSLDYILFVEYYITLSGCLVDRLPICVNGYTTCRSILLMACESLED